MSDQHGQREYSVVPRKSTVANAGLNFSTHCDPPSSVEERCSSVTV